MKSYSTVLPVNRRLTYLRDRLAALYYDASTTFTTTKRSFLTNVGSAFNKKKIGTYAFVAIVIAVVVLGIRTALTRGASTGSQLGTVAADALTVPIEKEFSFQVYDKDKALADPISYTITTGQLTKQIIIKGQRATAVKGRTFLIFNLKLVNNFDQSLFLNTRNYVRVQPAGSQDRLAPEIHNDTVEVPPISTKLTRIGLPVDENVKEFTLFIGEINGGKQEIPIKF